MPIQHEKAAEVASAGPLAAGLQSAERAIGLGLCGWRWRYSFVTLMALGPLGPSSAS
jgi:hypothetical protein